jgi:transposase, IS5 family
MRKLIEKQLKIGQVDICNIPVDLYCRDEIPQILLGLQAIYSNKAVRDQVFWVQFFPSPIHFSILLSI